MAVAKKSKASSKGLGNPGEYDAFAINMVKTDNAASYTTLLNK